MPYDSKIHTKANLLKSILWKLMGWLPTSRILDGDLLVVNYHGTPKKFVNNLQEQLKYLLDNFTIILPSQLQDFFDDNLESSSAPFLLMNFDDGTKNQLYAAELLEKYGIRAIFFVVPAFINAQPENMVAYFKTFIRPLNNYNINAKRADLTPLSWSNLEQLQKAGHEVGSHSFTHSLISNKSSPESSEREIVESKEIIVNSLELEPGELRSFCAPINSVKAIGRKEMELVIKNYSFFFATIPGSNQNPKNPYFIKRANIESFWMLDTVKYALSRFDWPRWSSRVKNFEQVFPGC